MIAARDAKNPSIQVVFFAIIFAQFCGTSLWFAGNSVLPHLQQLYPWPAAALGYLTGAVQAGFISGTLVFAVFGIADRFSPSRVFFICCLAGALSNLVVLFNLSSFVLLLTSRLLVGICLAGIYPVGMKIAADWQEHGLGHWLGALVGALVLGTSFSHGLKLFPLFIEPAKLLIGVSAISLIGGIVLLTLVHDGPYRKKSGNFSFSSIRQAFRISSFRAPALGYFGHMWELYAFWAFVPWALEHFSQQSTTSLNVPLFSFLIIAAGTVGCLAGGKLSFSVSSERVAFYSLIISGTCCLFSPLIWDLSFPIFISVIFVWGISVTADSPQFSTLVARNVPAEIRGSALTIVTCIGFAITIVSIQLLSYWQYVFQDYAFLVLAPGPIAGTYFFYKSLHH